MSDKLSIAMIVKNEEICLPICLESIKEADEIVIVDTGSTDSTSEVVRKLNWKNIRYIEGEYSWNDHFAEARNFVLSKVSHDWVLSIDADNILEANGIQKIKQLISEAEQKDHDAIRYNLCSKGNSHQLPWIFKKNLKWTYRVHNVLDCKKPMNSDITVSASYSPAHKKDPDRALRMLQLQYKEMPTDTRTMYYLAREYWYRKDYDHAIPLFIEHTQKSNFLGEVADSYLYLARIYWLTNKGDQAREYTLKAIGLNPDFKEALLFMAEITHEEKAKIWRKYANEATNESVLFIRGAEEKRSLVYDDKKPILCFFLGYTRDFNSSTSGYGSELALRKLAEQLKRHYNIFVFGSCFSTLVKDDITYMNSKELNKFASAYSIDIMIISRYIYYFLEFDYTIAKKTYLWLHDTDPLPWWDYKILPEKGKSLFLNIMDKLDKVICLTQWHKDHIQSQYKLRDSQISIIGNGISIEDFPKDISKVSGKFIYYSSPDRGLFELVKQFHRIRNIIPNAHLDIYGGSEYIAEQKIDIKKDIEVSGHIKYFGKISNAELLEKVSEADYWFYPVNFPETYCISALEAQMAGCLCISSDVAGVHDVLSDRGILLYAPVYSDDYWRELEQKLTEVYNNKELKQQYINKAQSWAKHQTWDNRAKQWLNMFVEYQSNMKTGLLTHSVNTILAKQRFEICKLCENSIDNGFGCKLHKSCCFGKWRSNPINQCPMNPPKWFAIKKEFINE